MTAGGSDRFTPRAGFSASRRGLDGRLRRRSRRREAEPIPVPWRKRAVLDLVQNDRGGMGGVIIRFVGIRHHRKTL